MTSDRIQKLRDQLARPVLDRIRADRQRVSAHLKPVLTVIERRLFEPTLEVNTLWRECRIHKDASIRFGTELDRTPWAYITERRVEVGAELLKASALKVWQIGDALGYNASTFSRAFQRRYDQSPSDYRATWGEAAGSGLPSAREETFEPLRDEGRASTAGADLDSADALLLEREMQELTTELALVCHERAVERACDGDADRAYEDLSFAHRCYGAAGGEIAARAARQQRFFVVACTTDEVLSSALCSRCRTALAGDVGLTLRHHLRQALLPVPRDLRWFEVCCDDCYRVIWDAVSRARLGLLDDAWKAWWLSHSDYLHVPEAPPSRGRIIAALAEVERGTFGDQQDRKSVCDLAVADAVALGDPLLEAQARIWRGNVLRALAELNEARTELARTRAASRGVPWLEALQKRMEGILAANTNDYPSALEAFASAVGLYETLDPHVAGLLAMQQANAHFFLARYEQAIDLDQTALSLLDSRRDPLPGAAALPIHLATSLSVLGRWESAESAISQCSFDREAHVGLAAEELFVRACLRLGRGQLSESLLLFEEAGELFEKLHRPRPVALTASYSIEAYARRGDHAAAIEKATVALRFFEAAGCPQNTLDALGQLRSLLESEALDTGAVTARVRDLARQHGGWLPEASSEDAD